MKNYVIMGIALLVFSACEKEDDDPITQPPPVNEEEVITKVQLTFIDTDSGDELVWLRSDPDGDGGSDPTFSIEPLDANSTYTMNVRLFNETENPEEEITAEIEEEDEEHQLFFVMNTGAAMGIEYADQDGNGNPIGLENSVVTVGAETVELTVILRHEPDKDAAGAAGGDPTNAGGETDIEVTFDGEVQ